MRNPGSPASGEPRRDDVTEAFRARNRLQRKVMEALSDVNEWFTGGEEDSLAAYFARYFSRRGYEATAKAAEDPRGFIDTLRRTRGEEERPH